LGKLFVVSGPSGGGKNTILRSALRHRPDIYFSVSATTRAPRHSETEGTDYLFVTTEEFERMRKNGEFLEYSGHLGQWYGTPLRPITEKLAQGVNVILDIETNGARSVFNQMPDAVGIFILPESAEILEQQLRGRGTESEEQIQQRLAKNKEELDCLDMYKYMITNKFGNPESAISEFEKILLEEN
jgi:guanylate kinase